MKLNDQLRDIINKYSSLIETNKFEQLYTALDKDIDESIFIPDISTVFELSGIHPLNYMTYIPSGMYYRSKLSEVKIPNNITAIQRKAFDSANTVKVIMGDGVKYIGDKCFVDCTKLTDIKLSDNIGMISRDCFQNCVNLTSIKLPTACTVIDNGAFNNCQELTDVYFNQKLNTIGKSAFLGTGLKSINLPSSIKVIEESAFSSCTRLKEVYIPKGIILRGDCFEDCENLISVTLDKGVQIEGGFNFSGCDSLVAITYKGTMDEFSNESIIPTWSAASSIEIVHCSDGDIEL